MKIIIPENIGEINLNQFQRYFKLSQRTDISELEINMRKIEIFTDIPFQKVKNIKQVDYEFILNKIDEALTKDCEFKNRFKLNDIEFGFIPNFDDMTVAELGDLRQYADKEDELHRTMSVLFRPINGKDLLGNYTIESYNGTSTYSELFKLMPLNIVNGALGFFLSLQKELEIYILRYTEVERVKGQVL